MTVSAQQKAERFLSSLRHCQILGMTVVETFTDGLTMRLPYSEKIIGNPLTQVVHGGSLTTLMDTASGTAVFTTLPGFELCPTLDLRMDYMKAAQAGQDLVAEARVVRITANVVFTECDVFQENDHALIARCNATFMRIGADLTPPSFRQLIENETGV